MLSLHSIINSISSSIIHVRTSLSVDLVTTPHSFLFTLLPLANVFGDPTTAHGIPCNDPFVQIMSSGLGFFLNILMEIGGIIGLICIVLCGLLRISALTTQKKEDKDERMFLSKSAFICAIIFLIPTLIFFILLVLLPHWYGLGDNTCH